MVKKPEDVPSDIIEINSENIGKPKRQYKKRETKETNSKSNSTSAIGQNEISALLCGVFSLVSMKAGEHWSISPDEANTVAVPLSNILKKMDMLEKVTNISDGAMLFLAVATLTIPRIMISSQMNNSKKKNVEKLKNGLEVKENNVIKESTNTPKARTEHNAGSDKSESVNWGDGKAIFATVAQ